jgi:short-subunit dehydrogenase
MRTRNKMIVGGFATGTLVAGIAAGAAAVIASRRAFRLVRGLQRSWGDDLRGHVVVITGSSRGLGLALAEEFARHGCKIVLNARNERELVRARQQVEKLGAEVGAFTCDVSRPDQAEHLINAARQQFGRVDILVNNAGIISVGPMEEHTLQDFREAMDTIFWGMVQPTLAALPMMMERRRGHIVNITSIGGRVSVPHLLPYSCAKFATVGFSEGLHAELRKHGIHVLTVVPGLMRTGSHLHAQFKGKHQKEYGWFAVSGTNPLISVSVERAARQIVNATRRNRSDLVVGWQARALMTAHANAPGLIADAMGLVNRFLPGAEAGGLEGIRPAEKKAGRESESAVTRSPLTALGRRAARRYNQTEGVA